MEIKEAIEELQKDIDWAEQKRYPYITTRRVEAVRLAIKALQYIETKGGVTCEL
jgi:HEPN domain-containing protein